jgi:hypothetical protein
MGNGNFNVHQIESLRNVAAKKGHSFGSCAPLIGEVKAISNKPFTVAPTKRRYYQNEVKKAVLFPLC